MNRHYSVESALHFEIAEMPKPGMARVLTSFGGSDELRFLAPDVREAEAWLERNRYSNARIELVPDPDPVILPSSAGRAA